LKRLEVDSALADILSRYLRVRFDEVKPIASEVVSSFAREVESSKPPQFYYLDPQNHLLYYNDILMCTIDMVVFKLGETNRYRMLRSDCRDGLAIVVLEEKLGEIAESLSQEFGIGKEEAERRLRKALRELKSDRLNAVKAGFARLLVLPPRSEEELGRELMRYTRIRGPLGRELIKAERLPSVTPFDVFIAWLVGKGIGYKLLEGYEVYESGDRIMAVAGTDYGFDIGWYRVEGEHWDAEGYIELSYRTYNKLKDVVLEDFRLGRPLHAIKAGLEGVDDIMYADEGYHELARAIYEVARDGRPYARVEEETRGGKLTIHVIHNPSRQYTDERYIFIVERNGDTYILSAPMMRGLLWYDRLHEISKDLYRHLARQYDPEGKLTEALIKALDNPEVVAQLPKNIVDLILEYLTEKAVERIALQA